MSTELVDCPRCEGWPHQGCILCSCTAWVAPNYKRVPAGLAVEYALLNVQDGDITGAAQLVRRWIVR